MNRVGNSRFYSAFPLPVPVGGEQSHARLLGLLLALSLALLGGCSLQPKSDAQIAVTSAAFDHDHALFDALLRQHVRSGLVNYRALQASPELLDRYLESLASANPAHYTDWTREQKLAFYINAYNAYTLKAIIEHYPIVANPDVDAGGDYPADSIRQIPGVWDRMQWPLLGTYQTLDYMEHTVLRKILGEPRIHFVLVCASLGCPPLENRAFTAADLDTRLDRAAHNYIYRDHKVQIDRQRKVVRLAQILRWFSEDFLTSNTTTRRLDEHFSGDLPGVLSWIHRYATPEDRAFLQGGDYRIMYLFYDWGLNEQR